MILMLDQRPPFAALLLAGGRSRRMGGDKALLEWRGQPLWEVQLERLLRLDPQRLLIACREEQCLQRTAPPPVEWLFDPPNDNLGPLGVIARALTAVDLPLLVLAVDLPRMTEEFLREAVLAHLHGGRGFFFETPHGYEPLAGLYVPAMLPILHAALAEDRLGLQGVIRQSVDAGAARSQHATPEQEPYFINTNTAEEWAHEKGRSE